MSHREMPTAKLKANAVALKEFELLTTANHRQESASEDILIIGDNIKGDVQLQALNVACNPIFGDDVFGFVLGRRGHKDPRNDCRNARTIRYKYPVPVIRTPLVQATVGSPFRRHTQRM
ncbi:hypothetical protein [Duncaniella muris]|uniref:hypothetical protein n=1 Tax=Duncaniella muris TaxID=2094150 RepID=UPI003F66DEA0